MIDLVTISCKHQVPSNGKVEHNFSGKKKKLNHRVVRCNLKNASIK